MKDLVHVKAPGNWINDPNGFIYYKGKYHLFFQHFPYAPEWGTMHWGHTVSEDLVHWEYQGIALFPTKEYDQNGVFSGTALEEDGKLKIYYSAVKYLKPDPEDIHRVLDDAIQTSQAMIVSEDGFHFNNWDKKKVLPTVHDEEVGEPKMRDPKVWKDGDTYYMIQGARTKEDVGQALIFESKDKINWKFRSRVESKKPFGYMWECPDYFEVDGTKILSASVQGLEGGVWDDRNVYQSGYFMVDGNILDDYKLSEYMLWDYGFDFYAPQSFETEDGRRVHISWMGMPDCEEYTNLTIAEGWQHCFTFPREVFVEDGKVCQRPVRELQKRKTLVDKSAGMLKKDGYKVYDVNISGIQNNEFRTVIDEELILEYKNGRFEMHFTSQDKNSVSAGRGMRYVDVDKISSVEILVDKSSVEVFVNNGEYVFTTRFYPQKDSLAVEAAGAEIMMEEIR